jgi:hypothetical protein
MDVVAIAAQVDLHDVLRLRLAEPPGPGAGLLIRERAGGQEHVAEFGGPDGVDLRKLGLTPGVWDVFLSPGGGVSPIRIGTLDPGFSLDGLREYATLPRDLEIRAYRTDKGNLSLRVRAVRPQAEVATVEVKDSLVAIRGSLAYAEPSAPEGARLALRARNQETRTEFPASFEGTLFQASVDLDTLAGLQEIGEDYWDCWLESDHETPLRLGKHLDDIPKKKTKIRYPARISEAGGRRLRIRPYYTVDDDLSLVVRELGE